MAPTEMEMAREVYLKGDTQSGSQWLPNRGRHRRRFGAEIDLVMFKDGRKLGVEFKREDPPRLTPSMRTALEDLKLEQIAVIYPGERRYSLHDQVEAVPLTALVAGMKGLFG